MPQTAKRIIPGSVMTAGAVTYYTAPSDTTTIIKKLPLVNATGGAVSVTVYLIPSGGSAVTANTLTYSKSVAAGETWSCTEAENMVLEPGGFIQAIGNGVTILASGIEIS